MYMNAFKFWDVFKTLSNIFDGAFLQKRLAAKYCYVFLQKSSIVDVCWGIKYDSDVNNKDTR